MQKDGTEIYISPWAIVKVILILIAFYLLYLIKDILLLFFMVLILSAAFMPIINSWEKKIKRIPAVIALSLIIFGLLAFISYIVFPPLVTQVAAFIQSLPDIIKNIDFLSSHEELIYSSLKSFTNNTAGITGNFVTITTSVFGGVFAFLTVIVMTIYLLLDKNGFQKVVKATIPQNSREQVMIVAHKMAEKVGSWFSGQLLLCLSIAIIDLIGLLIIGVPYALTLALLSGVLEIIPVVGPIMAGLVAALVALSISPVQALFVIILYIVVQQIENTVLVPNIMKKAVGLSPVIIILAVLIGAKLLGLIGALLAVPIVAVLSVAMAEWPLIKRLFRNSHES